MLKTWLELLRVKLYGNDLKGNKNYFELVRVQVIGSQLYKKGCICHLFKTQPCEQQHYAAAHIASSYCEFCNSHSYIHFSFLSIM